MYIASRLVEQIIIRYLLVQASRFCPPLQILFVAGIACIIGLEGTYNFFFKPQKLKGSLFFFAGIGVVLFGWAIIGFLIELYGIYLLFGYASVLVCVCVCLCLCACVVCQCAFMCTSVHCTRARARVCVRVCEAAI